MSLSSDHGAAKDVKELSQSGSSHKSSIAEPHTETATQPATTPPQRARIIACQVAFALCLFQTGLDSVIISNALTAITSDLGSSVSQVAWIGSSYNLAWAALLLAWAGVSNVIGRKPVMLAGLGMFVIGSVLAAVAQTMAMLLSGRVLQGLGAGACLSGVSFSINDMFALEERALAHAINGASMCFAVASGPLVGGAFTSSSKQGWRWCFWVNLPISGVAAILLLICHRPTERRTQRLKELLQIDWCGIFLVMTATISFLLALDFGGSSYPWVSTPVLALFVMGALTTLSLVIFESKFARHPLIPHGSLQNRSIVACLTVVGVHAFSFISCIYYAPLYFQIVLQASPLRAGIWQLASAVPLAVVTILSGLWVAKSGRPKPSILASSVLMTLGFCLFISFSSDREWARIISYQIIIACGIGPLFQAPLIAVQTLVNQEDTAVITSILNLTRTLGSAIGLVVGQSLFTNVLSHGKGASLSTRDVASVLPGADQQSLTDVTHAFRMMWVLYACVSSISIIASLLISNKVFIGGSTR